MDDTFEITTRSEGETEALGKALMGLLPDGCVVALRGDLGAGKTCLVRGMASANSDGASVSSPTFTMVNEYPGERKIYHLDLYRIAEAGEVMDLGYEDLFDSPDGVCVIEWAERVEALLPDVRVDVRLDHRSLESRHLTIRDCGVLPRGWQQALL